MRRKEKKTVESYIITEKNTGKYWETPNKNPQKAAFSGGLSRAFHSSVLWELNLWSAFMVLVRWERKSGRKQENIKKEVDEKRD